MYPQAPQKRTTRVAESHRSQYIISLIFIVISASLCTVTNHNTLCQTSEKVLSHKTNGMFRVIRAFFSFVAVVRNSIIHINNTYKQISSVYVITAPPPPLPLPLLPLRASLLSSKLKLQVISLLFARTCSFAAFWKMQRSKWSERKCPGGALCSVCSREESFLSVFKLTAHTRSHIYPTILSLWLELQIESLFSCEERSW